MSAFGPKTMGAEQGSIQNALQVKTRLAAAEAAIDLWILHPWKVGNTPAAN